VDQPIYTRVDHPAAGGKKSGEKGGERTGTPLLYGGANNPKGGLASEKTTLTHGLNERWPSHRQRDRTKKGGHNGRKKSCHNRVGAVDASKVFGSTKGRGERKRKKEGARLAFRKKGSDGEENKGGGGGDL